jgi:hypothetical protein
MKKLALLLSGFFGSIFAWISSYFTAKLVSSAVIVTVALAIVMLLFYSLKSFIAGIVSYVDDETFRMVFWSCWPSNAEACLAACWGTDISVFLYRYRMKLFDFFLQ